ncbi:MAG: phosphate acyltransferase PlsX [Deltaproteobacteria bacterium]|nr:phosphate acyltransferase PlsX [Deltaproteobacteria bacterium]
MKIAVDAMGGDHAPEMVVQGALQAALKWGIEVTLIGDGEAIRKQLKGHPEGTHVRIRHCDERVEMGEPPLKALRRKRTASIRIATEMVACGEADAALSAGNSGVSLAAAILTLGRVEGVERPAFAGIVPTESGPVILIDVGANVDCRPVHLFQFGIMADAFAVSCLGMDRPRIGLLSIGEEGGKGNEQVRLAHDLFRTSDLNFAGNVEGRDIFSGRVQIVVCDGFVGNVALKVGEGLARTVTDMLKREITGSLGEKAGRLFWRRVFQGLKGRLDYEEYGGAPILGIKGVVIVCHGASSAKAVKNAVRMADRYARNRIQDRLSRHIARFTRAAA